MKIILGFAIFIILSDSLSFIVHGNNFTLELVQVVLRHGDRVPDTVEIYKTDPYKSIFKSLGYGMLTESGKKREYQFGELLWDRYGTFLGDYRNDEIYAYSTNLNRTITSLQLVLHALDPQSNINWENKDITSSRIPVHTVEHEADDILLGVVSTCPKYGYLYVRATASHELHKQLNKYRNFYKYLKEKTDIHVWNILSVFYLHNNIRSVLSLGLPLPNWCSMEDYKKLQEIAVIFFQTLTKTNEMKRFAAASIFEQLLENINSNENHEDKRKMYLYCGHDVNIAAITNALNITGVPQIPDYGSAVLFETLRGSDNKVYMRMLTWTGVSQQMIPLKLNNCTYECPLSDYVKMIDSILPDDAVKKCQNTDFDLKIV